MKRKAGYGDLNARTHVVEDRRTPEDRYPRTPDGRYFVVRGRLWRTSNPALTPDEREQLVRELMAARRAVRDAQHGSEELRGARARVDTAKRALGERGPPWWPDGALDYNRHLVQNTPYAEWYTDLTGQELAKPP